MELADDTLAAFLADKGYDSDAIREDLQKRQVEPVIPPRSNRKQAIIYDKDLYKERNSIERLFGHLKMQRAPSPPVSTNLPDRSSTLYTWQPLDVVCAMPLCKQILIL